MPSTFTPLRTYRDEAGALYDVPDADNGAFISEMGDRATETAMFRDADNQVYDVPMGEALAFDEEMSRSGKRVDRAFSWQNEAGEKFDVPKHAIPIFEKDMGATLSHPLLTETRTPSTGRDRFNSSMRATAQPEALDMNQGIQDARELANMKAEQPVKAFVREAAMEIPATAAAMKAGATAGGAVTMSTGMPILGLAAGLLTGVGTGMAVRKAQDLYLHTILGEQGAEARC
jgi:hypothetical protein